MCDYTMDAKQNEIGLWSYEVYYDDIKDYDSKEHNLYFKTEEEANDHCDREYNIKGGSTECYFDENWNLDDREDCVKAVKYSYYNLSKFVKFYDDKEITELSRKTYPKQMGNTLEETIEGWKRENYDRTPQGKKEYEIKRVKELMAIYNLTIEDLK